MSLGYLRGLCSFGADEEQRMGTPPHPTRGGSLLPKDLPVPGAHLRFDIAFQQFGEFGGASWRAAVSLPPAIDEAVSSV